MSDMPQCAMVLAAGLGTRMRPLTDELPKPLVKVAGQPLIDFALDRFASAGVARAVVNVHYRADQIEEHLISRSAPEIIISDERELLLETGGGLKKARPHFGDGPVFCTNTDAILLDSEGEEACAGLAEQWNGDEMDAFLLLVPIAETSGYNGKGDFTRDDHGRMKLRDGDRAPLVFTGLQILSPALIDKGPDGAFSTRVLWDEAAAAGRLFGVIHSGFWMHVGDPAGLRAAEKMLGDTA